MCLYCTNHTRLNCDRMKIREWSSQNTPTVDWEYFVGSKLAWAKCLTRFNFVNLACVRNYFNPEISIH